MHHITRNVKFLTVKPKILLKFGEKRMQGLEMVSEMKRTAIGEREEEEEETNHLLPM